MAQERPLLAVLIDGDNASARDAEAVFGEVAALGEAAVRRIYGDSADPHLSGWRNILSQYAINPHDTPAYSNKKNSSDIALAIDAMDLLHTGRFGAFVIVSSDSDFTRLAARIREQGVDVYGIGNSQTNEAFRNACKRFIFVENLRKEDDAPAAKSNGDSEQRKAEPPLKVVPMVRRAMESIDPDADWLPLGLVGNYITRAHPDFDPRTYGSAKLSELLLKTKQFEMRKGKGSSLDVRRID